MSPYLPEELDIIAEATASPYFKSNALPEPTTEAEEIDRDREIALRRSELQVIGEAATSRRSLKDWPAPALALLQKVASHGKRVEGG